MAGIVKIFVEPTKKGEFRAELGDGSILVESSHQPFLEAARMLVRRGADPKGRLVMYHKANPGVECLRSKIGTAAKLRVEEHALGPRFRNWEPPEVLKARYAARGTVGMD